MHGKNAWKQENKWKRRGIKVLPALDDKNPWRNLGENDKNLSWNLRPIEEREGEAFESFEIVFEHVRNKVLKKISIRFSIDRKLDSIDWKSLSIDPTTIELVKFKTKF